jgi:hypothetical protein
MPYATIRKAIEDRASLTAHYDSYVRFISPHILGDKRDGAKAVLAYQYAGGKPGGLRMSGEWGCFLVSGLMSLRRNSDSWHPGHLVGIPSCVHKVDLRA